MSLQRLSEVRKELLVARDDTAELATKVKELEAAQQEQAAGSGLEEELAKLREANKGLEQRVMELEALEQAATEKATILQVSLDESQTAHRLALKEQQDAVAHLREQLDASKLAQSVRYLAKALPGTSHKWFVLSNRSWQVSRRA